MAGYFVFTWLRGGRLSTIWRQRGSRMLCRGPIGPCEAPYGRVKSIFLIDCFVTKFRSAGPCLSTRWMCHFSLVEVNQAIK